MILGFLLLPMFFFLGIVTSYEDFRFAKIRNKWVAVGMVWGLAVNLSFYVFTADFSLLKNFLLNSFFALSVAYLIWRFSGWSAGDAKLFFVFSLLIPLTFYQKSYLPIFPSFVLLINILILILAFLFFRICIVSLKVKNFVFAVLKNFFRDKNYWLRNASLLAGLLGLFLIFGFLKERFGGYFPAVNMVFAQTLFLATLIIFRNFFGAFFIKPAVIKTFFLIFLLSAGYGFVFFPRLTLQIFFQTAPWLVVFIIVLVLFGKLLNAYVSGAEKRGRGSFSMAIWIFLGGVLTLILKGSVLSLFSGNI
jgi:hypothetical protein